MSTSEPKKIYHGLHCCGCGKAIEGINKSGADNLPFKLWIVTPLPNNPNYSGVRFHAFCSIVCLKKKQWTCPDNDLIGRE